MQSQYVTAALWDKGDMSWRKTLMVIGSAVLVAAALSGGFVVLTHTGWLP